MSWFRHNPDVYSKYLSVPSDLKSHTSAGSSIGLSFPVAVSIQHGLGPAMEEIATAKPVLAKEELLELAEEATGPCLNVTRWFIPLPHPVRGATRTIPAAGLFLVF